jgi:hypothetical protein
MKRFTIILISLFISVSCQLSAATGADVRQASCDVYSQSQTHPYRVSVIVPQVEGGKAIQP